MHETRKSTATSSAGKINNGVIKNIRKNDRKLIENRQPQISIKSKKKKIVRNCFVKLRRIKTKLETHETSTSQTFIEGSQCRPTMSLRKKKVDVNKCNILNVNKSNILKKPRGRQPIPTDECTKLIKLFESGKSIIDAAYELGINISTAKNNIWRYRKKKWFNKKKKNYSYTKSRKKGKIS